MERLTTDETYCQFIDCDADAEGCACDCTECRMYKRLQAYEQTGLEPDEIKTVQMLNRSYQYTLGGMSIPEFLELVEAKKEDRLIVLPAKLGDRVYTVAFENCWGGKCCWLKDGKCVKAGELDYCPQEVIEQTLSLSLLRLGVNIYRTREEAETALEKSTEERLG